ncbi:hypothetical protein NXF25_020000 [Crotalus adamanteus]|uniref:Uncharacterized protein n=1 Tax=Crotalus adamanteus TaxID=8729 RepID=A0AAW1B3Y9_CROAD
MQRNGWYPYMMRWPQSSMMWMPSCKSYRISLKIPPRQGRQMRESGQSSKRSE